MRTPKKLKFKYQIPTPEEWGQICSIPWSETERRAIAAVFRGNGFGYLELIFGSNWPLVWRLNQKLKKHNLSWRLRVKTFPKETRRCVILYKIVE